MDARESARSSLHEAVAREKDLYLGWLWLGDAEDAAGRPEEARKAWLCAFSLHAGGDVLARPGESSLRTGREEEAHEVAPPLLPGETLRYSARYLLRPTGRCWPTAA
jgi:hypothetical protein